MFSEFCVNRYCSPLYFDCIYVYGPPSPPGEEPACLFKIFFLTSDESSLLGQLKSLGLSHF